ncbi:GCN5-related N-acetyltransferase [Scytonema sp. HK-05]|uniref:GNAT family N-acetyltransferase n=1 Tax=Scytonema sp. HK-05 TaxID=1137095 RepID=UPI0009359999|nr:GNAT family N-acetyltransferase [Scytonema sp. HK-05]OKH56184.1 GNAT family N-acetyltransferase [Scytonema sp. HK-05]BAY49357.1 GCN5-related N-acetyltransferase [Scytonema sp. HK-05]
MLTDSNTIYAEGYQPGCIGRITELHGLYYSQCWGVGADWEIIVAREFCDFCEQYNTEHDLLVTAIADNRLIGSVAIVGDAGSSDHTDGARLRWFIVDPAYQGRGIGKTLLKQAIDFSRRKAFPKVYLWTVDKLPQSRHLYESIGFHVVAQEVDARYSTPLLSLKMEKKLS